MLRTTLTDPFELEPSTAAYVPRPATVKALAELQAAIEREDPAVLLRGPAGIGKTLLLRLLRRRVEGRMRCVELEAAPTDTADSLCAAALRELDRDTAEYPVEELARVAGEFGRAGVLLEIDRAQRLSPEALGPLVELAARCPMLQLVLAAELPEAEHAWLRSPDPRISVVELSEPMTASESLEYLRARLELAVAPPEIRRKLGWWSGLRLIRESRGNPALLHHLARRVVLGDAAGAIPEALRRWSTARKRASRRWWIGATAAGALALIATALWLYEPAWNPPVATGGSRTELDAPRAAEPEVAPVAEREAPRAALPPVVEAPAEPVAEELSEVPASPEEDLPEVQAAPPPPARAPPPRMVKAAPAPASSAPAKAVTQEAPSADIPEVPAPVPAASAAPESVSLGAGDALARPSDLAPAQRVEDGIPVFVNAVPSAQIEIDGREVGRTPIVGLPVPPGERRFAARFADGRRVERTIRVEGSEVYVLFP